MLTIYYFLVIFALIWGPYLNIGIKFFADTQAALAGMIIVFTGVATWTRTPREIRQIMIAIVLLAVYAVFLSIGYEDWIYVPALRLLRAAVLFYASWCLIVHIYDRLGDRANRFLVTAVYLSIVTHGLLMIVQFLYPGFREAMVVWTFASEGLDINLRTRMPGLTNGGGAQLSAFMSMGFILFPYCFASAKSWYSRIILVLGVAVIAISVVLSGRTGVYTAIFLFPIMLLLVGYHYREAGGAIAYITRMFVVTGALFVCMMAIYYLDNLLRSTATGDDYRDYAFARNLDMLTNPDEGLVRNSTFSELWNYHVVMPEDLRTMFFGDLENMDHSQGAGGVLKRTVDSDIGYVRLLFGYGLFGSLFHYIIYLAMILNIWRVRKNSDVISWVAMFLLVMIFIFNAKEVFVFTRIGWSICALLYCGAICSVGRTVGLVGHPGIIGGADISRGRRAPHELLARVQR